MGVYRLDEKSAEVIAADLVLSIVMYCRISDNDVVDVIENGSVPFLYTVTANSSLFSQEPQLRVLL